jgi:hypothetical protein
MRKPDAAAVTAGKSPLTGTRSDAATELVCVALALALLFLAMRIVSIW